MAEIGSQKILLKDLFSDKYFYCIPEYQRPYSWREEQCQQLFDDIWEADRESEYFFGAVILQEKENNHTNIKYDVIDGQQRLTTLQILMACLRDKIESNQFKNSLQQKIFQEEILMDGVPEQIRLSVKEKQFFREYVQEENGTLKEIEAVTCAQKKIKSAIQVFRNAIQNLKETELKSLCQYISQKCVFICLAANNFDNAYRLFTVINDRGLQLRRCDVLKTNNLDPTIIPDGSVRTEYAEKWEKMEEDLGVDQFEQLVSFIRNIEIKEKSREDILKEYDKLIFNKGKLNRGIEFIHYVEKYKKIYQSVVLDNELELETEEKTTGFRNLIYILIDYFPSNEWIPAILLFYEKFRKQDIYTFLLYLERKITSDWVLTLTPTKRTVNINNILKEISRSETTDELFKSNCFEIQEDELRRKLDSDVYGEKFCKYILMKLEFLESEQNVERRYGKISIEHVLPQKPKDDSEWVRTFTEEERKNYTNKLCNLVLLSKRKNASASNKDFDEKKKTYLQGRMMASPRNAKILAEENWTPHVLEKRQNELLDLLMGDIREEDN